MEETEWDGQLLRSLAPEWSRRIVFLPECGSTNDEARRLAEQQAEHLTVVLTERQQAGRGRRGQAWTCPPGEGLAFSMIIRPEAPTGLWSRMALAAGLAVAEGLEFFGVSAGLKWPNDVWLSGRKICGILVEAGPDFVVVGVGINVNVSRFPDSLAFPATSLSRELGRRVQREEVVVCCLARLGLRLGQIDRDFEVIREAWEARCVLTGKTVTLESAGDIRTGRVEGLSLQGELLLRGVNGLERILQANEIRELTP